MKIQIYIKALAILLILAVISPAGVRETKHNFTSQTYSPNAFFRGARQVCVFCHTAHNGNQSLGPLWNHDDNPSQTYIMYSSPTLDMDIATTPHNGSLICLSCHDGTIAINSLNNLPGPEAAGNYGTPGGTALDAEGKLTSNSDAFVSTDLTDDHPVGITYDSSRDLDFVPKTGNSQSYPDKLLYQGLYVECTSCHNPHDNSYSDFLIESNDNSNLCMRCHIK